MNTSNPPRFTARGLVATAEQTAIQLAQDKVVLIDANAGAAKTTTLAIRIGEAIARNLPPEQILALVFTPEARDVMRQRLVDVGIARPVAARIKVATFEQFAGEVLLDIEGGDAASLPHAKDLRDYVLAALEQVGERYHGRVEYLDVKTHNLAISQFLELQQSLKARMALDEDLGYLGLEEAATVLGIPLTDYLTMLEYERMRLGSYEGTLFRGPFDASYDLARSLEQTPELEHSLPAYRVLVCDELHDLNEPAFRILTALLKNQQCYFIGAGDKDQVIHARLGASEAYLNRRFGTAYPALVRYPLTMSYRYGPHLAFAMAAFKQKQVRSSLGSLTEIRQLHYDDGGTVCAAQVQQALLEWQRDKRSLDGCAILVRNWDQSVAIENGLMQAQIAYRTQEMPSYLQREEILFLRGMIAIALNNLHTVKADATRKAIVEALAIFCEVELTPEEMEEAKKTIARDPDTLSFFFTGQLQRSQSQCVRDSLAQTMAYIAQVDPDTGAAVVLQQISTLMHLEVVAKRIYVHPHEAAVVARTVAGFTAAAAASGKNLREFAEWLGGTEKLASHKPDRHTVLLESVANSKGKEFEHVILPYLEAGAFPDPTCALGEEENLFYVAATRARVRLTLLSPLAEARRSPFLQRLKLTASMAGANAALDSNAARPAPAPAARHELKVPFAEKEQAKALGAEWDMARRVWYVKPGLDLQAFARWLRG